MGTQLTVADNIVVSLEYALRLEDGELIDSSTDEGPLVFIQGFGHIIPGLEDALYGMMVGDEREVVVEPEDGYGEYDPEDSQWLSLDDFPDDFDLELGMPVELVDDDNGLAVEAYVAEFADDEVLLDFNHPLAGETLHFHVRVVDLRPATDEELDHGHVHDDGHDFEANGA